MFCIAYRAKLVALKDNNCQQGKSRTFTDNMKITTEPFPVGFVVARLTGEAPISHQQQPDFSPPLCDEQLRQMSRMQGTIKFTSRRSVVCGLSFHLLWKNIKRRLSNLLLQNHQHVYKVCIQKRGNHKPTCLLVTKQSIQNIYRISRAKYIKTTCLILNKIIIYQMFLMVLEMKNIGYQIK